MSKQFVEIAEDTMRQLEEVAESNGYTSVEKLLTDFARQFSGGCSVTISPSKKVA